MKMQYNVQGMERKRLAETVAEVTGEEAVYQNAPTFDYKVGLFTITRDGSLEYPDDSDSAVVLRVLDGIAEAGFIRDGGEPCGLTIRVPADKVNVDNLTRLLDAKGDLIRKALGIEALPVEVGEDAVSFPWFDDLPDADSVTAYTHLISALCQMSSEQKRINATARDVDNEKYAFRCFLLRLGFIGEEYKTERKILTRNLSGSAAFRDGGRHEVFE